MSDLNKGQEAAREEILEWAKTPGQAISLSGPAGTGKTFLVKHLLGELGRRFSDILLTATTGKAALRLAELTDRGTTTLHSKLYAPPTDDNSQPSFTKIATAPRNALLVVDEASMITPDVWGDLKKWMAYGVRVLFVGDGFQLPPVITSEEKKNEDFNIFSVVTGPRLTEVMRNGDVILDAATALRVDGKLIMADKGAYRWRRERLAVVLGDWLAAPADHAIVTWRNKVRMSANRVIRKAKGLTSGFPTPGEPILVRRNGRGFLNGQIVLALEESKGGPKFGPVQTSWLRVETAPDASPRLLFASCMGREEMMDGILPAMNDAEWKMYLQDKRRFEYAFAKTKGWEDEDGYPPRMDPLPITWGYALTCHAAQGSEWNRVTVYLEEWDTKSAPFLKASMLPDGSRVPFWTRWVYTALTRAKRQVDVVIGAG
jgi:exodeoxyribonuclease V